MRIRYTYNNYPNSPKATEYSRSAESSSAYAGIFIGPLSIGAVIAFLVCTFGFFGKYNWGEFLGAVAFSIVVALIDFCYFIIRPNNTHCEIKVILTKETNKMLSETIVSQYCATLRKENKKQNLEAFKNFFAVFLVSLFDAIALIAAIKGTYFLCHKKGGALLLWGGIVAVVVFTCLVWKLAKGSSSRTITNTVPVNGGQPVPNSKSPTIDDIAFCRKCGAKILPDSIFCAKCGTKLR